MGSAGKTNQTTTPVSSRIPGDFSALIKSHGNFPSIRLSFYALATVNTICLCQAARSHGENLGFRTCPAARWSLGSGVTPNALLEALRYASNR